MTYSYIHTYIRTHAETDRQTDRDRQYDCSAGRTTYWSLQAWHQQQQQHVRIAAVFAISSWTIHQSVIWQDVNKYFWLDSVRWHRHKLSSYQNVIDPSIDPICNKPISHLKHCQSTRIGSCGLLFHINCRYMHRPTLVSPLSPTHRTSEVVVCHIARLIQGAPAHDVLHCQAGLSSSRSLAWSGLETDVDLVVHVLVGETATSQRHWFRRC